MYNKLLKIMFYNYYVQGPQKKSVSGPEIPSAGIVTTAKPVARNIASFGEN